MNPPRRSIARAASVIGFLFAAMLVGGCSDPEPVNDVVTEEPVAVFDPAREIRFVRTRWQGFDTLTRQGLRMERYEELAERFAERQGKSARWVLVDRFDALIPALLDNEADIIATNLTITPERAEKVVFSAPLTAVSEWVVARRDAAEVDTLEALGELRFGVPAHASYAQSLADYPALADARVVSLPAGTLPDEVLETLVAGEIDATVMDDVIARTFVDMRDDVKRLFTLPTKRHLAWATRPTDMHLIHALDEFITESHVNAARRRLETRDLKTIEDSGRIRMLTLDGPISYYLWRGELMGFDYELVKRFADSADLELEVVVAPSVSHLVPWLMEGRADLIAATLTITSEREKQGVAFTRPYLEVNEVIVSHVDVPPVASIDALEGQRVFVNPGTSHFTTANKLRDRVDLEVVSMDRPVEDLILAVALGEIDLTIADDHVAEVEAHFQDDLRIDLVVSGGHGLGWAVKKEHTELLGALDNFIRREYRGKHYGILRNKYFRSEARFKGLRSDRIVGERLSPYDEQVKALAAQYGFDWRLIVAQMYQESRFDPEVRSRAGARGLLQVVPRTARELGVDPGGLADPVTGLEAGVRYLAWTRERFPDDVPVLDRMWFALAAYNAGPGHVFDARILARRQGWDADRWFGDVDKAMLLLGQREYASKARHGWVRGREPVNYVASIRDRYQAYVDHFEQLEARSVPAAR